MRKSGALFNDALRLAGTCVPVVWLALSAGVAQGQEAASPQAQGAVNPSVTKPFQAMINTICSKCHNTTDWAGGFAFDSLDVNHPG